MFKHAKFLLFLVMTILVAALMLPSSIQASSISQTFTPVADAFVYQSNPSTNYGSNTSLRLDDSPIMRSFLRFNLSGLTGYTVTSAALKLYANSSLSTGFEVNKVSDQTWGESTITYNNAPAIGSGIKASGPVSSSTYFSVNVTSAISGNGAYSFGLSPLSATQLNLASRESGSHTPQLVLSLTSGSTLHTSTPTRLANTGTPAKTLTATPRPTSGATSTPTSSGGTGKVPVFSHVIFMIFENKEYSSVVGSSSWPNFNALARQYALLTNDYAVSHPSLPNYLALTSGSTQGISSDCTTCYVNATNIADSIEKAGRTWKAYMESMPSPCYLGNSGDYAQKHNPFVYYDDIRTNSARCQQDDVPLTQLDSDLANNKLPNFAFITPNLCDDAHDCSGSTGDKFLGSEVNKILSSAAFDQNSLLIITFDEGSSDASCCNLSSSAGGHVATILISPLVKPGYQDSTPSSHYALLKTLEKAWGMPYLAHTADTLANLITAPWK